MREREKYNKEYEDEQEREYDSAYHEEDEVDGEIENDVQGRGTTRGNKSRIAEGKIDGLKHRMSAKILAFILLLVSLMTLAGSIISIVCMFEFNIFDREKEVVKQELFQNITYSEGSNLVWKYMNENLSYVEYLCGETLEFQITDGFSTTYATDGIDENENLVAYEQVYTWNNFLYTDDIILNNTVEETEADIEKTPDEETEDDIEEVIPEETPELLPYYRIEHSDPWINELLSGYYVTEEDTNYLANEIRVTIYVDETYPEMNEYYFTNLALEAAYQLEPYIWQIGIASSILSVLLFIFLLTAAGYRRGYAQRQVCGTARLPYAIFLAPTIIVWGILVAIGLEACYIYNIILSAISLVCVAGVCIGGGLLLLMDLVVRISTRTFWSNLLLVRIFRSMNQVVDGGKKTSSFAWKEGKKVVRVLVIPVRGVVDLIRKVLRGIANVCRTILHMVPLMWKAVIFYFVFAIWTFCMAVYPGILGIFFWIVAQFICLPIYGYCCIMFKKMQLGSKAIGEGNLDYEVDTKYCVLEFKEMGDSLNSIVAGMETALEEKMKSERMKTELISNVSHDIKTPLTSIVNYADLISKEETENAKIHEYSEILLRQSERLKRLTEDLVHASKVTSGNVDVHMAPCDIGVLLNQAIGEYEEKLEKAQLKIVSKLPEESVIINADGRHMWRVFDNLLNNICKYAQEGTRVYLVLDKIGHKAVISFKNISKYELNISEEELMERFVRGDKSRHSDGNGLGLSIAKSLVTVQDGEMKLAIDGDLFKVVLMFEKIEM